jgi:hypothetical protein
MPAWEREPGELPSPTFVPVGAAHAALAGTFVFPSQLLERMQIGRERCPHRAGPVEQTVTPWASALEPPPAIASNSSFLGQLPLGGIGHRQPTLQKATESSSFERKSLLLPVSSPQSSAAAQKITDQHNVKLVLVPLDRLLAFDDAFQTQHGDIMVMEARGRDVLFLFWKGPQPGHLVNEVHRRAIFEINDCVRGGRRAKFSREILHSHVFAWRKIDPDVHVHCVRHHTLRDGGGHPDQRVLDALGFDGFQKPDERRFRSNMSHRSCGVAARPSA